MEKDSITFLRRYTGTKTVKAAPMGANYAKQYGAQITEETINKNIGNDGYLVEYPDGYRSWSPKKVFDEAYRLDETPLDSMKNELADLVERIKKTTAQLYDVSSFDYDTHRLLDDQLGGMERYAEELFKRIITEEERRKNGGIPCECNKQISDGGTEE